MVWGCWNTIYYKISSKSVEKHKIWNFVPNITYPPPPPPRWGRGWWPSSEFPKTDSRYDFWRWKGYLAINFIKFCSKPQIMASHPPPHAPNGGLDGWTKNRALSVFLNVQDLAVCKKSATSVQANPKFSCGWTNDRTDGQEWIHRTHGFTWIQKYHILADRYLPGLSYCIYTSTSGLSACYSDSVKLFSLQNIDFFFRERERSHLKNKLSNCLSSKTISFSFWKLEYE